RRRPRLLLPRHTAAAEDDPRDRQRPLEGARHAAPRLPMRTNGVLVHSDPRRVAYGEVELPPPGPGDVVVEPPAVGVCRSALELADGRLDAELDVRYPLVFGHEWSGVVLEPGEQAGTWRAGDRVVGAGDLAPRAWFGFARHGAASERFTVPAHLLHRLPE